MNPLVPVLESQKKYQNKKNWMDYKKDKELLIKLRTNFVKNEQEIYDALKKDLNKSDVEAFLSEYSLVIHEINYFIKNIGHFRRVHKVHDDLGIIGHKSAYVYEPYGTVLVMSPFNYPLQLSMVPMIGAIAAGNSVILKLSQQTPHINRVIEKICKETFEENRCYIVDNDLQDLYKHIYELDVDLVFFTGSERVGKELYENFSKKLIPVILELGGKSPVIVDGTFDIDLTAKRLVWGKLMNFGQTCVAPDYIVVHESVKQQLIEALKKEIETQANNLYSSDNVAKIINKKQKTRLEHLMDDNYNIAFEYKVHENEPTFRIVDIANDQLDTKIMTNEIFGPILPVVTYKDENELWTILNKNANPLATYIFSSNKELVNKFVVHWKTGGVVNNMVIMHLTKHLPFGGIRSSGVGSYHQEYSYKAFSHIKSILKVGKFDASFMYGPHLDKKDLSSAKKIIFKMKKYK